MWSDAHLRGEHVYILWKLFRIYTNDIHTHPTVLSTVIHLSYRECGIFIWKSNLAFSIFLSYPAIWIFEKRKCSWLILLSKLLKITPDNLLNLCSEVINLIQVKFCPCAHHEAVWESGIMALRFSYSALYQDEWSCSLKYRFTPVEKTSIPIKQEGEWHPGLVCRVI